MFMVLHSLTIRGGESGIIYTKIKLTPNTWYTDQGLLRTNVTATSSTTSHTIDYQARVFINREYKYTRGSFVNIVYKSDDILYPDQQNGYSYETTYSGAIIMSYGGSYYWYEKLA